MKKTVVSGSRFDPLKAAVQSAVDGRFLLTSIELDSVELKYEYGDDEDPDADDGPTAPSYWGVYFRFESVRPAAPRPKWWSPARVKVKPAELAVAVASALGITVKDVAVFEPNQYGNEPVYDAVVEEPDIPDPWKKMFRQELVKGAIGESDEYPKIYSAEISNLHAGDQVHATVEVQSVSDVEGESRAYLAKEFGTHPRQWKQLTNMSTLMMNQGGTWVPIGYRMTFGCFLKELSPEAASKARKLAVKTRL